MLSTHCPRHALASPSTEQGSHLATVVAEFVGPSNAGVVPAGHDIVQGIVDPTTPRRESAEVHAYGDTTGTPHCMHFASSADPTSLVPGVRHSVTHGIMVEDRLAVENLPVSGFALDRRHRLRGGHGRHRATEMAELTWMDDGYVPSSQYQVHGCNSGGGNEEEEEEEAVALTAKDGFVHANPCIHGWHVAILDWLFSPTPYFPLGQERVHAGGTS